MSPPPGKPHKKNGNSYTIKLGGTRMPNKPIENKNVNQVE